MKKSKDLIIQIVVWAITAIVDYLCESETEKRRKRQRPGENRPPKPRKER